MLQMNLYNIFLIFNVVIMTVFSKNIDVKSGLEEPIPSSVGLKFVAEINNLNEEDCAVDVYPDECCLYSNDDKCDIIEIMGDASDVIAAGATKTFTMVAPLLDVYQRRGYCTLYIDSKPVSQGKTAVRDTVKITFDTKLKKNTLPKNVKLCKRIDEDPRNDCNPVDCDTYYNGATKSFTMVAPLLDLYQRKGYCMLYIDSRPVTKPRTVVRDMVKIKFDTKLEKESNNAKSCKHFDEDPFHDCIPVDCDIFYNGKKSHFCEIKKRCAEVPTCLNPKTKLYKVAYDPVSNKCIDTPAIGKNDLDYIKELINSESIINGNVSPSLNTTELSHHRVEEVGFGTDPIISTQQTTLKDKKVKYKKVNMMIQDEQQKTEILDVPGPQFDKLPKLSRTTKLRYTIQRAMDNIKNKVKLKKKKIKKAKARAKTEAKKKVEAAAKDKAEITPKLQSKAEKQTAKQLVDTTESINELDNTISDTNNRFNGNLQVLISCLDSKSYTTILLPCIVILQCLLICLMLYCMNKNRCNKKKPVIKKLFNYRQDASITTPLIGTSNIDTETTEYQYMSESSNYIDKRIKCYKACQKDRKNNMKLSMSDDILSKCINRRDWLRVPKSETIPEVKTDDEINMKKEGRKDQKKITEIKVNFQEEYQGRKVKVMKSIADKSININGNQKLPTDSSEREIRCHNYNSNSNTNDIQNGSFYKTFGVYRQQRKETDSIEKGAQAYFSNDSIEEFLSERGVLFIGDNASKYSYTSLSSAAKSTASSESSKTSKNNIVKNVLTLLSKKVKGPSSDPGVKKSTPDLELELLHLSRASLSSNAGNNGDKGTKRIKDFRSAKKTITVVAPLLDPYERKGYCTLKIDSRSVIRPRHIARHTIKIEFNTILKEVNLLDDIKLCKQVDEDPLNDCKPVNCDTYYNGKKSHFSVIKQRCFEVPTCLSNKQQVFKSAYNPITNKCIHKRGITNNDLEYVKNLTELIANRRRKEVTLDNSKPDKFTDITGQSEVDMTTKVNDKEENQEIYITNDTIKAKPKQISKNKYEERRNKIINYLNSNLYTAIILFFIIIIQSGLICAVIYCLMKRCDCVRKRKAVQDYFKTRHDVSITTPLIGLSNIGTSNIDTKTTECQYVSESSNYIDKKIKCYKACQKGESDNLKLSMSDDILSKCIKGRDWDAMPKSETIPDIKTDVKKEIHGNQNKFTGMKVNFQEKYHRKAIDKTIFNKDIFTKSRDELSDSSEKEICCYDYNSSVSTNTILNNSLYKGVGIYGFKKKTVDSTGTHPNPSNNYVNAYLSERDVTYSSNNLSICTYTSLSSITSSQSSKTSKDNVVKNVLKLLSKKAKGRLSDPGFKNTNAERLDLRNVSSNSCSAKTCKKRAENLEKSTSSP